MADTFKKEWAEVAADAESIFQVWASDAGKELDWANSAWIALGRAGFTSYSGGVQRTVVLLRFLALGVIFREFCQIVHGEQSGADVIDWARSLQISAVRVGQALGPHCLDDSEDDPDLEEAVLELIDQIRHDVFEALVKGFGNESILFLSLWRASQGGAIDEPEDDTYSVLNDETPEKGRTFEWITEGMPGLD